MNDLAALTSLIFCAFTRTMQSHLLGESFISKSSWNRKRDPVAFVLNLPFFVPYLTLNVGLGPRDAMTL